MNTEPRARRPGGRSARVQAAVHRATTELIVERGVDQLTIPAVAERAGVNPTTVYRRWGTLSGLLAEIATLHDVQPAPASCGDLRADLEDYAIRTLADLSRPGGLAFFRAEVGDVDERRAGLRECLRRCSDRVEVVLAAARDRGEAPPALERVLDRIVAPLYFHVVFSLPGTDEDYARGLVADLLGTGD